MELSEHLFRREAGRMVATLTRMFGVHNLALAEDIVQDAFCRALEVWKFRGVPENPSAWLMVVAKNRAPDLLRRERSAVTYEPELARFLQSEWTLASTLNELFAEDAIRDDQLRMMFSCCHPRLAGDTQVVLILNILCGFSIDEIAAAYLSSHAAIEKRITRAKKLLASSKTLFDITDSADYFSHLPAVHRALYLLFNEGYHGASSEAAVRAKLCHEAMRLAALLLQRPLSATPVTHALSALMCLDAARLPARLSGSGELLSLFEQDRSLWDRQLIADGLKLLELSAAGPELSEYHIEAAIASVHVMACHVEETDWGQIVSLYDQLMVMRPSPVVALNRSVAIAQHQAPGRGLEEIRGIANADRLADYPFYHAALGEFELQSGRNEIAREHFANALGLARNPMERKFFKQRIDACGNSARPGASTGF
jgi:RNA polymerase sigma factor (sigma-70 family)